jgi:hypothetical protein
MFAYYSHIEPCRTTHSGAIFEMGGVKKIYFSQMVLMGVKLLLLYLSQFDRNCGVWNFISKILFILRRSCECKLL